MRINHIYNEDCLITMGHMPNQFIDLTVTSPPYDGLRDYNGYSFDFENIAKALYRITKKGGVVVWVVGDAIINGSETGTSFKQALYFKENCGFNLHDTMLYKKNGAAYPANKKSNRYSQIFEYMFVFSKDKPKTKNLIKDKLNRWAREKTFGQLKATEIKAVSLSSTKRKRVTEEYGYRDNIWKYNNGSGYSTKDDIAYNHPAIFPETLAADHINSWSNESDLVYDPFMGSGTTAKMSHLLKRNWIGSEISSEYVELANNRIDKYIKQQDLF
jgi:DNA modification methylase